MNEELIKDWWRHSSNELCPDEYIAERAIKNAQKIYDFCLTKIGKRYLTQGEYIMNHTLDKLTIRGFKSIRELEDFERWHYLTQRDKI